MLLHSFEILSSLHENPNKTIMCVCSIHRILWWTSCRVGLGQMDVMILIAEDDTEPRSTGAPDLMTRWGFMWGIIPTPIPTRLG